MSLDSDAVVIPGTGHFYTAPSGTAYPAAPTAPASPWVEIGHTSVDSPLSITRDGGDRTKKGSWQNSSLRETVADITYGLTFQPLQMDEASLQFYFGGGSVVSGKFWVPYTSEAQEHALFIRVVDGTTEVPFYLPYCSTLGDGNVDFDPEEFTQFPLATTILADPDLILSGLFAIDLPV